MFFFSLNYCPINIKNSSNWYNSSVNGKEALQLITHFPVLFSIFYDLNLCCYIIRFFGIYYISYGSWWFFCWHFVIKLLIFEESMNRLHSSKSYDWPMDLKRSRRSHTDHLILIDHFPYKQSLGYRRLANSIADEVIQAIRTHFWTLQSFRSLRDIKCASFNSHSLRSVLFWCRFFHISLLVLSDFSILKQLSIDG